MTDKTEWILVPNDVTANMASVGNDAVGNGRVSGTVVYRAMLSARPPVPEDVVTALANKLREVQSATVTCPRCAGKGYHHGFGEDGHDPDWCDTCGGAAFVPKYLTEEDTIRALIAHMEGK